MLVYTPDQLVRAFNGKFTIYTSSSGTVIKRIGPVKAGRLWDLYAIAVYNGTGANIDFWLGLERLADFHRVWSQSAFGDGKANYVRNPFYMTEGDYLRIDVDSSVDNGIVEISVCGFEIQLPDKR